MYVTTRARKLRVSYHAPFLEIFVAEFFFLARYVGYLGVLNQ